MINLQSTSKQMIDELQADYSKAIYWFKKKCGGDKAYEKMRDVILHKATVQKENVSSDKIEYYSKNGNKWMVFECAKYYADAMASNTAPYAFCFYETEGSIGAFVPVIINGTNTFAVVIFTSHFFYRLGERLNIDASSPEMLRMFVLYVPEMLVEYNKEKKNLLVRLPGSTGWGVLRDDEGRVFEVRTFLTDAQLSKEQLRKTKNIRENASKVRHEPIDITNIRIRKIGDDETKFKNEMERITEHYHAMGEDKQLLKRRMDVYMCIGMLLGNMNYVSESDAAFWQRMGTLNKDRLNNYVKGDDREITGFLALIDSCLRTMNIRNFDKVKAKNMLECLGAVTEDGRLASIMNF